MSVVAILPTIPGREEHCEWVVDAFKAEGVEILLVKGSPTCGEGWAAGLVKADADYILLGTDDMEPHPGAVEAGVKAAEEGIYPSPRIVRASGQLESCGSLGGGNHLPECGNGTLAYMSSLPIASRESWEKLGPPLPIHYYVDDYLGYRARSAGLRCEVVCDYAFTHHQGQHGIQRVINRAMEDRAQFLATCGS